ncbi:hypothetical protein [Actinomadura rupiterrae]|uniref:hypothetical protein n=1 Tax=Actinomadura rupiterrae TaxID=559627 RepID=UPI0020A25840|nr:hypothetical protein [Actinomadura rupiterrae]MCP2343708.1 hypothetical protein [Actinomadura rupiterrae]
MDEELTRSCLRWLTAGMPDDIRPELTDDRDYQPLGIDQVGDVAVVAVLRWWNGPPGHSSAPPETQARRPFALADVRRFCKPEGTWLPLGGGGGPAPDYPLAPRRASRALGGHVRVKGTGRTLAEPLGYDMMHAHLLVSAEVAHLRVADRELDVPFHGNVFVVWSAQDPVPVVVASDTDGIALAEMEISG